MAGREILPVSIDPEQEAFGRDRGTSARFGSTSEIARAALRLLVLGEAATTKTILPMPEPCAIP